MEKKTKHFRKRDAILNCVRCTDVHPTAEWVYTQLKSEYPDISLGTVYRNLNLFKEQGIIASLGTVKGVERFDGNTDSHVHYICTGCGKVLDLAGIHVPEEMKGAAARDSGGVVHGVQLSFTGMCPDCQKSEMEEIQ